MIKCCSNFFSRSIPYKQENGLIWRDFFIHSQNPLVNQEDNDFLSSISYCPFCGTKLPVELSDYWFDILEIEHGIVDTAGEDKAKVPAEFRTDEWWKKRGL